MLALIVAIIVLGLAFVISTLVMFRYGLRDNQTLPPSTAADNTLNVGTLIAFAIAASPYLDRNLTDLHERVHQRAWRQLVSSGEREPLAQPETSIKNRADGRSGHVATKR
jgi:hypothetical protein